MRRNPPVFPQSPGQYHGRSQSPELSCHRGKRTFCDHQMLTALHRSELLLHCIITPQLALKEQ
jgi:hypothetical protein